MYRKWAYVCGHGGLRCTKTSTVWCMCQLRKRCMPEKALGCRRYDVRFKRNIRKSLENAYTSTQCNAIPEMSLRDAPLHKPKTSSCRRRLSQVSHPPATAAMAPAAETSGRIYLSTRVQCAWQYACARAAAVDAHAAGACGRRPASARSAQRAPQCSRPGCGQTTRRGDAHETYGTTRYHTRASPAYAPQHGPTRPSTASLI